MKLHAERSIRLTFMRDDVQFVVTIAQTTRVGDYQVYIPPAEKDVEEKEYKIEQK